MVAWLQDLPTPIPPWCCDGPFAPWTDLRPLLSLGLPFAAFETQRGQFPEWSLLLRVPGTWRDSDLGLKRHSSSPPVLLTALHFFIFLFFSLDKAICLPQMRCLLPTRSSIWTQNGPIWIFVTFLLADVRPEKNHCWNSEICW